jgi:hypothetical protein
MKSLKILLVIAMVFAFASIAIAATVTITGDLNDECTLGSMSVDSNGNIVLNVSNCGTASPCTPSSASVSPSTISRSVTEGSNASSQTMVVRDNCYNNLQFSASTTDGWISVSPSIGTGTINATFNTASLQEGSYTGHITVTPQGYSSMDVVVNLTVNSASSPPGTSVDIGSDFYTVYPNVKLDTIAPNGINYYYFTMNKNARGFQLYVVSLDRASEQLLVWLRPWYHGEYTNLH